MYRDTRVAVVIPCYNEEKLITTTVNQLPKFVDYIIAVNDGSSDSTLNILKQLKKQKNKLQIIDNEQNGGVGKSLKDGYAYALEKTDATAIGVVSGDAQCDPNYLQPMLDDLIDRNCDYVKGNRFMQRQSLKSMPAHRKFGNIFISLLTKFSTGYYSISDTTMGFGFFKRSVLEQVDFSFVKNRYDYETSMLVALSIAKARIKDHAVPAIYGSESSTINFLPTVIRVLRVVWVGFWQRVYYRYILFSFHPIIIFMFGGLLLSIAGWIYALFLLYERIVQQLTPTSGTVMLAVLPIILGLQLLLTAIMIDIGNEDRP